MNEAVRIPTNGLPLVRARQSNWAPWAFAGVASLGALLLYNSLEAARADRLAGSETSTADIAAARPLPDLAVPSPYYPLPRQRLALEPRPAVRLMAKPPPQSGQRPAIVYRSGPASPVVTEPLSPSLPVYQPAPTMAPPPTDFASPNSGDAARTGNRAFAQKLANPSFTVAQGVLIPAVLETALDSSRAGPARAIVSRDVPGFDRKQVLIPRGSKLIGEYQADVTAGQNRASVTWTRLIRPDGVTIDLRSPAADGLGRAGIQGKVNNHTMRRVGDALLQTLVGIGSGLTQRAVTQPIIVVPGGPQAPAVNISNGSTIQPTLTVAQGSRISVFVARDLDFSGVDEQP
jgi:type IV secretion system protein VirB10